MFETRLQLQDYEQTEIVGTWPRVVSLFDGAFVLWEDLLQLHKSAIGSVSLSVCIAVGWVLWVGAGSGCKGAQGEKNKKERAVPVEVQPATAGTLVSDVRLAGEILADVEVRVFSLIPERITKLKFEEGDRVKKGQVLAVIKPGALWQAVRQAKAGLEAAKTQRSLAKVELDRTKKLFNSRTVAIAALQRAQAQFNVASAQVQQMSAAVGQTFSTIANIVIKAPISGVVGQRFLNMGDLAGPGLPLCTIIQTDSVRVKAMATEFDLVKLKKKQPASVSVPAFKKQRWLGTVDYISPVIDRRTRAAWVTVVVKNPGGALRPGMFADLVVTTGRRSGVILIPARGVIRRINELGKVDFLVFLAQQGRAVARPVKIGRRQGGRIEIAAGLKIGEPVIVVGNHKLRDKTKIRERKRRHKRQNKPRPEPGPKPESKPESKPRPSTPSR